MAVLVSVGQLCDSLAKLARQHRHGPLNTWLKLAANEAHLAQFKARVDLPVPRVGAWDWDVANDAAYVDAVCGDFFGYKPDVAARGQSLEKFVAQIHDDDRKNFLGALNGAILSGDDFKAEYRVLANGGLRWVRAQGNCVADEAGRPLRVMGSIGDITHLKTRVRAVSPLPV